MSEIVAFLERVGQDAQLRYASAAEVDAAASMLPAEARLALANGAQCIAELAHAPRVICCGIFPGKEDEEEEEEPSQEDEVRACASRAA